MSENIDTGNKQHAFRFKVRGMDCANCAKTIEQGVQELNGVDDVRVNFTTEIMQGYGEVSVAALRERLSRLGYGLSEDGAASGPDTAMRHGFVGFLEFVWQHADTRTTLLLGIAVLTTLAIQLASPSVIPPSLVTFAHWAVIAIVGYPIANRAVRSLIYARRITIELLMTAATLGALAIGASGEAITVVLLFSLGEALEGYSAQRSRASLHALLRLRPDEATLIRENSTSGGQAQRHYERLPVTELALGDRVLVKPGERIPADGRIVDGTSAIDESAITGESVPVSRELGGDVFAGTINGQGTLIVEVACRADDFTISQIARLVEQAQAQRSPAERFVDRFAQWYTPAVVVLAVSVAIVPPLAFGQAFLADQGDAPGWLYRGLALLIVACPCALIISIPVTVVSALTRLAGLGVLVKGGAQLSALAKTKVFAFDKTGTLTHGRPAVMGTRSRDCTHEQASTRACGPCDDLVAIAASVERGSTHPFAHAVLEAASDRELEHRYEPATEITSHAGRGVTGNLNGRRVTVGHEALFESTPELDAMLADNPPAGNSVMLVGEDERLLGYIQVDDQLRSGTKAALADLKAKQKGCRLVMLTGDRREVAEAVAQKLEHIDEIRSDLMPEAKLEAVRELEARRGAVAMIGDGINDTPALAGAELGVAMGGKGSPQAMEVADVVLMQDDLSQLSLAVSISRKTQRLVRENIAVSLGLKLVFLALAIPGITTLWMAVLADVGATVLVTLNGMRMLRAK